MKFKKKDCSKKREKNFRSKFPIALLHALINEGREWVASVWPHNEEENDKTNED